MTHTYHDCIKTHPTSGVGGESFTCSECGKRYVLVIDQPRYWEQEDINIQRRLETEMTLHMTQARTNPSAVLKEVSEKCFEALGALAAVHAAKVLQYNRQQEAHMYFQMPGELHHDINSLAERSNKKRGKKWLTDC